MQANRQLELAVVTLARAVRLLVGIIRQSSSIGSEQQAREALPLIAGLLRDAEALLVGEAQTRAQLN